MCSLQRNPVAESSVTIRSALAVLLPDFSSQSGRHRRYVATDDATINTMLSSAQSRVKHFISITKFFWKVLALL
jgi:hypothetical protein